MRLAMGKKVRLAATEEQKKEFEKFISQFRKWAQKQENIIGVFLVGSWARNDAKNDSDIDLVIICSEPKIYLENTEWINQFAKISSSKKEDWGLVQEIRTFYDNGLEIEFGLTSNEWINSFPIDPGTYRVIHDGVKVLLDRQGQLRELIKIVSVPTNKLSQTSL